jgi:hypothetical protein
MTLTELLHGRSSPAPASPPPTEIGEGEEPSPSKNKIRAVALGPTTNTFVPGRWESPATSQIPVVRFGRANTAEYPAYVEPFPSISTRPQVTPPEIVRSRSRRRRSRSPLALRIVVFTLFVLAVGAAEIAHTKPAWLPKDYFRPIVPSKLRVVVASSPTTMKLVTESPSQSVYTVPNRSFNLVVSIDHPCWVMVKSVPSGTTLFTQTLLPGKVAPISVKAGASILLAARANSIAITDGTKTIGTISNPLVSHTYIFENTAH